jgi:hydrogenase large subunit
MTAAAVQTLDISPVGRVEGDLDVRVNIENGVVVDAWTSAELFRGFELILKDKDPQAGLVVTPRACGICGARRTGEENAEWRAAPRSRCRRQWPPS